MKIFISAQESSKLVSFLSSNVWNGIGVISPIIISILGVIINSLLSTNKKLRENKKDKMSFLYNNYSLLSKLDVERASIKSNLNKFARLIVELNYYDKSICHNIENCLLDIQTPYKLVLTDDENYLIITTLNLLSKNNYDSQEIAKNLNKLIPYFKLERSNLNV